MPISADKTHKLGTVPVARLFFRLALPATLGQLVTLLNNVIDRAWIGHIPTNAALSLTAVGICFPIILFFMTPTLMIGNGLGPFVSIALGRQDRDTASRGTGANLSLALVVNVILCLLVVALCDPLLVWAGCSSASLPFAHDYLVMSSWGLIASNVAMVLGGWFNAQGDVRRGVTVSLLGVVVNMVLDPIFIFWADLGIAGAALATSLGGVVSLAYGLFHFFRPAGLLRVSSDDFRPRWSVIRPVLAIGLPTWFNMVLESVALFVLNSQLSRFGGDIAVATVALFNLPTMAITYLLLGVSMGAQPIVSYNYGSGDRQRMDQMCHLFIRTSFLVTAVIWAVLLLFPRTVWSLFTRDTQLLDSAIHLGTIYFAVVLLNGIQLAQVYILKFLGQVRASLFLGILKRLVLLIPLLLLLPLLWRSDPERALVYAIPATDFLAFVITHFCYRRTLRMLRPAAPAPAE